MPSSSLSFTRILWAVALALAALGLLLALAPQRAQADREDVEDGQSYAIPSPADAGRADAWATIRYPVPDPNYLPADGAHASFDAWDELLFVRDENRDGRTAWAFAFKCCPWEQIARIRDTTGPGVVPDIQPEFADLNCAKGDGAYNCREGTDIAIKVCVSRVHRPSNLYSCSQRYQGVA